MIKVVVDRRQWLRGENYSRSYLLRPEDDKMCCLGFACLASGLTPDNIRGVKSMFTAHRHPRFKALTGDWATYDTEKLVMHLEAINDDPAIIDAEREARLIESGAKVGLQFKFVN